MLSQILPLLPKDLDLFLDLFAGGGNVGINSEAKRVWFNDKSIQIIGLLRWFYNAEKSSLQAKIDDVTDRFNLSNTKEKGYSFYNCNSVQGLASYNKEGYLRLREEFNAMSLGSKDYYLYLYVLVVFGFNNQLRFNTSGKLNIPVGKRDFNRSICGKLQAFCSKIQALNPVFSSNDFRDIVLPNPDQTFVYADPPYLISNATYNENNLWQEADEAALLAFLTDLDEQGVRFALSNVLSHKDKTNRLLKQWVLEKDFHVHHLNVDYSNSNYHKKDRLSPSDEVLITNY